MEVKPDAIHIHQGFTVRGLNITEQTFILLVRKDFFMIKLNLVF